MANEYIFDIVGNDKNNIKMMEESLLEIKNTLFDNLYNAEKAITEIFRFDLSMDKYMKRTTTRCTYSIPLSLIPDSYKEVFRRSRFYKKDISLHDIISNPDIFYLSMLIFIDGDLYTNASFYIKPEESLTMLSFDLYSEFYESAPYVRPGFTQIEMDSFVNNKTPMTILFLPSYQVEDYNTTKNNLYMRTMGDVNQGIEILNFNGQNDIVLENVGACACFLTRDDDRLYKYSYTVTTSDGDFYYYRPDEVSSLTNSYTFLKYMRFRNALPAVEISHGTDYFTLEQRDFPIPIENIVLFRKNSNGIKLDHESTLTMYYPNYYKINKTHTDDIVAWVFYKDDTTYGLKHRNELRLYEKFTKDIISKYNDDTIPDLIKNYKHISTNYGIDGFKSQTKDALHYKIDTLIDLIRKDGDFYRVYLNKLTGDKPQFYIDVSEIEDLQSRYRIDTSLEDPNNVITFDEPCYMFIFYSESSNVHHVLTINNRVFAPMYTIDDGELLYMYIPVSLITPSTFIYVQKYFDYPHTKTIIPVSVDEYFDLEIDHNINIMAQDIFVTMNNQYISKDKYEIYTKTNDNQYKKIIDDVFYPYENFYIKIIDTNLLYMDLKANVSKTHIMRYQCDRSCLDVFTVNEIIDNDKSNMRLFKNGQLLPSRSYKIKFKDNVGGPHNIHALVGVTEQDRFTFTYTADKYHLVYEEKLIDESGVINVYGKINKPIDLKWYDIFVNGLRITENEIEILAPYLFVIKNIPTRKNLQIYQINLDPSNIIDTFNDDISNKIYENINEIKQSILSLYGPLDDSLPDLYDDIYRDYIGFIQDSLWLWNFINPDIQQITQDLVDDYSDVLDSYNNFFINPDITVESQFNTLFNPDNSNDLYIP